MLCDQCYSPGLDFTFLKYPIFAFYAVQYFFSCYHSNTGNIAAFCISMLCCILSTAVHCPTLKKYVVGLENRPVMLSCTLPADVKKLEVRAPGTHRRKIYSNNRIRRPYAKIFHMNVVGQWHNLTLNNLTSEYAGSYDWFNASEAVCRHYVTINTGNSYRVLNFWVFTSIYILESVQYHSGRSRSVNW